jgi:hypothetical protein
LSGALIQLFDTYSLRARLQPALLSLLPLFITIAAWFPTLYEAAAALVGLAAACGLTMLLAQIARVRGRMVEEQLFSSWGGKPTTMWLRHRDDHLDTHTKARYHVCLAQRIPDWQAPTIQEEGDRSAEADARYDSAARWLRERTRDKGRFPILFHENVSYGFRRNLYGLKAIGTVLAALTTALNGALLYGEIPVAAPVGSSSIGALAFAFSILALATWLVIVTPTWVRDASDAYARTLLASCDEL